VTSPERTPIDNPDPGASAPGSGDRRSTGKNSNKPVDRPSPSPDTALEAEKSTVGSSGEPVQAENGEQPLAEAELAPETASHAATAIPEAAHPGGAGGSGGGDESALSDIPDEANPPDAIDGRADSVTSPDPIEAGEDHDELTQALKQRDEYLALAQRTQADFENFRKRTARDAKLAEARGMVRLVKELLPVLDNLGRALSAAAEDDPLLAGVRLVHEDLGAVLRRHGVESYSPQGERFDPAEHEAMAQHPVEGVESGTVVEVYQAGYRLDGTVIRPARVVVAT
jgi:molecular chaperone GrpE